MYAGMYFVFIDKKIVGRVSLKENRTWGFFVLETNFDADGLPTMLSAVEKLLTYTPFDETYDVLIKKVSHHDLNGGSAGR